MLIDLFKFLVEVMGSLHAVCKYFCGNHKESLFMFRHVAYLFDP